jgi:hypothetical protein
MALALSHRLRAGKFAVPRTLNREPAIHFTEGGPPQRLRLPEFSLAFDCPAIAWPLANIRSSRQTSAGHFPSSAAEAYS